MAGELVVARSDGNLTKTYNYVFGVSSAGDVYFSGPYKGFSHHVTLGQSVEVNSLFGQTPHGKNHLWQGHRAGLATAPLRIVVASRTCQVLAKE
jgi:hypothetical protein